MEGRPPARRTCRHTVLAEYRVRPGREAELSGPSIATRALTLARGYGAPPRRSRFLTTDDGGAVLVEVFDRVEDAVRVWPATPGSSPSGGRSRRPARPVTAAFPHVERLAAAARCHADNGRRDRIPRDLDQQADGG